MSRRLLTCCARILCGTGNSSGLAVALAGISDWNQAYAYSRAENLSPVLYKTLLEADLLSRLPEDTRARLTSDYWSSRAAAIITESELERVTSLLVGAGVTPTVLKGAAVAAAVYDDPALRLMSDLDLVVRPQDFEKACETIQSDGDYSMRADMHPVYREFTHAVFSRACGLATTIELHQTFLGDIVLPNESELWNHAVAHPRGGLMLCPEDSLVHLCAHAALRHQLRSLSQLLDIGLVIRSGQRLNWERVVSRAARLGVASAVTRALETASRELDLLVPDEPLRELRGVKEGWVRKLAIDMVCDSGRGHSLHLFGSFLLMPGLRTKAKYAAWNLLPPVAWLGLVTGKRRRWVYPYYPFRVFRAACNLARFLGRRLLPRSSA